MTTKTYANATVDVDAEGFLTNAEQWTPAIAGAIATELGIELNDQHWKVIEFVRADTKAQGQSPGPRRITTAAGVSMKDLYALFPKGPGKLVAKVGQLFMSATDFSPEIKPSAGAQERVFELRTYAATPGKLEDLHARFRDHTLALFAKHGMTNFAYWQFSPDQKGAADTLIYLLAHKSVEAAKASFTAFRADPDWVAARQASEEKAGAALTVPEGVKSVFLKPTDYSQSR